jgi:1-acyl-sn-glycerol-3-phosphate acyltransferase
VVYALRFVLIALYTVVWSALACAVGLVDRSGDAMPWIARQWVRWILWTCRVRVEASGLEQVDLRRPHVWMSNHQSVFDVAAIVATIPVSWRFVAKRELTRIPLFGWALRVGGHVIVDRGDRERSVASLREAARRVAAGTHVIIFPEGTRSPTGRLRGFKSGGFHLAIEAGVPIVPVTVSGSRRIAPKRSLRVESGLVRVRYGRPIPTEGMGPGDLAALKERVREAIAAGYDPDLQEMG